MIKYLELTAPTTSAFRQAKIVSIECNEGDRVDQGATLFRVKSGGQEIDLPSTQEGRVVELIATVGENITLSTALLLLETEVEGSTATPPLTLDSDNTVVEPSKSNEAKTKNPKETPDPETVANENEQENPDLLVENFQLTQEVAPRPKSKTKPQKKSQTPAVSKTMSSNSTIEVTVPDIGADSAKVIEILVNVGDTVAPEDALITLESDKASMDVPSTDAGIISAIKVTLDQDVSEGTVIIELTTQPSSDETMATSAAEVSSDSGTISPKSAANTKPQSAAVESAAAQEFEVAIPDIGGDQAKVIEVLVSVGDQVDVEDALITLESDKASMDVPSTAAGEVVSIEVQVDQDVGEGDVVVKILSQSDTNQTRKQMKSEAQVAAETSAENTPASVSKKTVEQGAEITPPSPPSGAASKSHASPSIRRFARELGVDLSKINGSGRKGRITQSDVKGFVKGVMSGAASSTSTSNGAGIPAIPAQDFSKFGDIEVQPLNKIKRLTATNLHRSWLNVPHVTHNDEANINDLESFRKELNAESAKTENSVKLSPLAFVVKAVVHGLRHYPQFNSSLDASGENLILKKYINIGIAVETPNGLVVPVLRDADKKSISEIAQEMGALAAKARDKKLTMNDMSGACFTISSLGGIGGTNFTPIINAPEVAILGVSRSKIEPIWNGQEFEPGTILPLSLSYDHRVIDGAEAARFTRHIAAALQDVRRLTI